MPHRVSRSASPPSAASSSWNTSAAASSAPESPLGSIHGRESQQLLDQLRSRLLRGLQHGPGQARPSRSRLPAECLGQRARDEHAYELALVVRRAVEVCHRVHRLGGGIADRREVERSGLGSFQQLSRPDADAAAVRPPSPPPRRASLTPPSRTSRRTATVMAGRSRKEILRCTTRVASPARGTCTDTSSSPARAPSGRGRGRSRLSRAGAPVRPRAGASPRRPPPAGRWRGRNEDRRSRGCRRSCRCCARAGCPRGAPSGRAPASRAAPPASAPTSRWVTAPPILSSPLALTPASSGMPFTSTSAVNSVKPSLATSSSSVPPQYSTAWSPSRSQQLARPRPASPAGEARRRRVTRARASAVCASDRTASTASLPAPTLTSAPRSASPRPKAPTATSGLSERAAGPMWPEPEELVLERAVAAAQHHAVALADVQHVDRRRCPPGSAPP